MQPGRENVAAPTARVPLGHDLIDAAALVDYVVVGKREYDIAGYPAGAASAY